MAQCHNGSVFYFRLLVDDDQKNQENLVTHHHHAASVTIFVSLLGLNFLTHSIEVNNEEGYDLNFKSCLSNTAYRKSSPLTKLTLYWKLKLEYLAMTCLIKAERSLKHEGQ
jgi:hypothetical protein